MFSLYGYNMIVYLTTIKTGLKNVLNKYLTHKSIIQWPAVAATSTFMEETPAASVPGEPSSLKMRLMLVSPAQTMETPRKRGLPQQTNALVNLKRFGLLLVYFIVVSSFGKVSAFGKNCDARNCFCFCFVFYETFISFVCLIQGVFEKSLAMVSALLNCIRDSDEWRPTRLEPLITDIF